MQTAMEVLIVGAGLTGSLIASALRKASNASKLTIWEKAGWIGGRTLTYIHPISQLHVDMGAQYISRSTASASPNYMYTRLKDNLYEELLSNGVLIPFCTVIEGVNEDLTKSIQNYVAPKGFSSIVEHFLAQSRADLLLGHHLSAVTFNKDTDVQSTTCKSNCKCTGDQSGQFDVVILTMPTPELLEIKGDLFNTISKELRSSLSSISYAPRYALGLFYSEKNLITEWTSKYFEPGDDNATVIRYASWGTGIMGREEESGAGSTLLLHSGVEFATKHQETAKDRVKSEMMLKLDELVPGLPPPSHSHLVNWKYARANRVPIYHNTPGCLVLSLDPMVLATGDGLCDTNFESCIKAALATVQRVKAHRRWSQTTTLQTHT